MGVCVHVYVFACKYIYIHVREREAAHVMAIRCFKGYRSGIRGISAHECFDDVLFYISVVNLNFVTANRTGDSVMSPRRERSGTIFPSSVIGNVISSMAVAKTS